eukprot:7384533-Alexandrium_andersonii.AAC.1
MGSPSSRQGGHPNSLGNTGYCKGPPPWRGRTRGPHGSLGNTGYWHAAPRRASAGALLLDLLRAPGHGG